MALEFGLDKSVYGCVSVPFPAASSQSNSAHGGSPNQRHLPLSNQKSITQV
ncbi:hypothetical protein [Nostoc sp. WHI]|uniref:hypothetical protein n=1 Tax=Nostoc sp. WHI TaxID=2650611 RepID=UPI0018C7DF90|nr:hypothetical protein [Nostoc sp. WHI]